MRFWDTSALVPLIAEEPRSAACRRLHRADPGVVVWALTRTEMVHAVRRAQRTGALSDGDVVIAVRRMERLAARWTEVDALLPVRERAERLLALHPLYSADALQLGAALVFVGDRSRGKVFVTADEPLAKAAGREGFDVVLPKG